MQRLETSNSTLRNILLGTAHSRHGWMLSFISYCLIRDLSYCTYKTAKPKKGEFIIYLGTDCGLPQPYLLHVTTGLSLSLFMLQFFVLILRANNASLLKNDIIRIRIPGILQPVYNHSAIASVSNACVGIPQINSATSYFGSCSETKLQKTSKEHYNHYFCYYY